MPTATDPTRARRRLARGIAAVLLPALLAGCGQPQVSAEHRELVLRLATGTSARDEGVVGRAAAEIERLTTAGELTDGEEVAFRGILDAVEAGDWERAREMAYALRDGQEPTEEDRKRVERRTLPAMKKVGPGGATR